MEPLVSYSGLELTLVEIILGVVLVLIGAMVTLLFARRGRDSVLQSHLSDMSAKQAELQGRLAQFADDTTKRDTVLREALDSRLNTVTERVGKTIVDTQERNAQSLKHLHERLVLIDRAQKNIETLSGEVSGLQSLLSNKQARGAFGEKQMQDLIKDFLPPRTYSFQHTLSNKLRVDALIIMPEGHGDIAIDSKFPMESWRRLVNADNTIEQETAKKGFRSDIFKHVKDISSKYLISGETYELALMFLPSDAIFVELHTNFDQLVEKSLRERVVIVSPTTFMATLHTIQSVMNDAEMQKNAAIIKREVGALQQDVDRLDERVGKLRTHFDRAEKSIASIQTSSKAITRKSKKISKIEFSSDNQNSVESESPVALQAKETNT